MKSHFIRTLSLCVWLIMVSANVLASGNESTDSAYRRADHFIYISTVVPIDPATNHLVSDDINLQVKQVFENLRAVVRSSGATMQDIIKITVYMDDIDAVFPIVKEYIPQYFAAPYPARSPIGGLSFGKTTGFRVAVDAIVYL